MREFDYKEWSPRMAELTECIKMEILWPSKLEAWKTDRNSTQIFDIQIITASIFINQTSLEICVRTDI